MYGFWYDYVEPKYSEKAKLCYIDTESFIVQIKTNNICKGTAEDAENRLDTSKYELDRSLSKRKKVIRLMNNKLGKKVMTKFVGLRKKAYSYLIDGGSEDKKAKAMESCVIKRKLKFGNYKNYLETTHLENKINRLEKGENDIDSLEKGHKEFIKKKQ